MKQIILFKRNRINKRAIKYAEGKIDSVTVVVVRRDPFEKEIVGIIPEHKIEIYQTEKIKNA